MNSNKKLVIITGANGNLGSAVTKEFLAKDYQVVATVLREETIATFEPNPLLDIQVADLTKEAVVNDFIKGLMQKYGRIDAAMLLAGGFAAGDISNTTLADIKQQVTLNFDTAFNIAKPVYEHMIANKKGKLVFIGSRPALNASQGKNMVAYSLSKSMLFSLAELINESAKGTDVTATVIAPSTIDTPINRKYMPDADTASWVTPEALATLMTFIAGDEGSVLRETILKAYNNA